MFFRRYEVLILLSPSLVSEQIEAFKSKVTSIIASDGGQVIRTEEWGRKRLAYPVRKELFGYYILYDFRARPALADELERNLSIDEQVFKYLTLVLDKKFTQERLDSVLEAMANEAAIRREKEQHQNESKAPATESDLDEDDDYSLSSSDDTEAQDVPSALEPQAKEDTNASEDNN
jgi:small subunit ribosomal protein S6